jgi:hypothetical protein
LEVIFGVNGKLSCVLFAAKYIRLTLSLDFSSLRPCTESEVDP